MIKPPKSTPPPNVRTVSVKDWSKGYMSSLEEGRMPNGGLVRMMNAELSQNGTVRPRGGLAKYGKSVGGKIVGAYEFVDVKGNSRQNKIAVVAKPSNAERASLFISEDDAITWKKIENIDFHPTARCRFLQASNKIIITNGEDFNAIFDIEKSQLYRNEEVPNVSEVRAEATGLTGENMTYCYVVTAVKNGETARSEVAKIKVSKPREEWVGDVTDKAKEFVKITWKKVDADKFIIYTGLTPTTVKYLTVVPNSGDGEYQSYVDSGRLSVNANFSPPNSNSTRGVRTKRAELIAGRIYLIGDSDDLSRVTYGGQGRDDMFDFSAFSGGWIRLSPGTKEIPAGIKAFRNGRGEAVPMVWFSSTNGVGSLKYIQNSSTNIGNQVIMWQQVIEDNGRDGTDAPDAMVIYGNSVYYLSKSGFNTTGTKPQLLNVLSTDKISDGIKKDVDLLNNNNIHKTLGIEFGGRIYFALPVGSDELNQVWILDLVRGGAWNLPWTIDGISDMFVYGGKDGVSRLLMAIGDRLFEMNTRSHTDNEKPFVVDIGSGAIKFSSDGSMWSHIVAVTFTLLKPKGKIRFSINGKTEDSPLTTLADFEKNFKAKQIPSGWGDIDGWSDTDGWTKIGKIDDTDQGEVRFSITKDIDEVVNYLTYNITSSDPETDYELSDVIIQCVNVGSYFEENVDEF